jgi:signal transduction histidine kinase
MKANVAAHTLVDGSKDARCTPKSALVSFGGDVGPLLQRAPRAAERQSPALDPCTATHETPAQPYAAPTSLTIGPEQPLLSSMTSSEYQLTLGRELERSCLARELHDSVIQQLLGISYRLAPSPDCQSEPDSAELTRQEILDVITQLRGVIGTLRPLELQELGLATALKRYVSRLRREQCFSAATIELQLDQTAALPDMIALCLFRTAQELLRNALKHGQAQRVRVRLQRSERSVTLSIHDDGCGFHIPAQLSDLAEREHYGLLGVAERIAEVKGRLTLRSQPGMGTQIVVQIPLHPAADQ